VNATANETEKICPECGAENLNLATRCWLCQRDLGEVPVIVVAEVVSESPDFARNGSLPAWTSIALAGALFAVGLGATVAFGPGAGILLVVVGVPAYLATLTRLRKIAARRSVTVVDQIITFLVSTLSVLGILLLMGVAAFVAFFMYCLIALSRHGL
jgi:hypothetical protein